MNEKICPKCGSKQIVPSYNKWNDAVPNNLAQTKGMHGVGRLLDSRYMCQDCGYVGRVVEKGDDAPDPDMVEDIKKVSKELKEEDQ